MAVTVLYEDVTLASGVDVRPAELGLFLPLAAPLPVGTRLVLERAGVGRQPVRVNKVQEGAEAGVYIAADGALVFPLVEEASASSASDTDVRPAAEVLAALEAEGYAPGSVTDRIDPAVAAALADDETSPAAALAAMAEARMVDGVAAARARAEGVPGDDGTTLYDTDPKGFTVTGDDADGATPVESEGLAPLDDEPVEAGGDPEGRQVHGARGAALDDEPVEAGGDPEGRQVHGARGAALDDEPVEAGGDPEGRQVHGARGAALDDEPVEAGGDPPAGPRGDGPAERPTRGRKRSTRKNGSRR